MFWADYISQELRGKTQHIDDMFTPSGFAHVGSLRGPILHDVVYKVLKEIDKKTVFTYVFNDFDPIDGLPDELRENFSQYLGYPLKLAPSPDGKHKNFADYFASDFIHVLQVLGVEAEYLSSWDLYHEGRFNEVIKIALNNVEKIQDIYKRISGSAKKEQGWYPFQVICPKCHKLGTTRVTGWDGVKVRFKCEENMVCWAVGCGYEGEISPYDGNGKLPWKVDWPAHWKVLGVTFEGAGKDHASRGGSYDIAFSLCSEVFNFPKPYYFPYEHFLLGGKKMSSSKGIGLKARELIEILPPELARFLIVRKLPKQAIEFSPEGNSIPDLFDEFDRCAKAFWSKEDKDLGRIFELSQVDDKYLKKVFLPRFRIVSQLIQFPNVDLCQYFSEDKGEKLNITEKKLLEERIHYAKIWLEKYALPQDKISLTKEGLQEYRLLSENQKKYLSLISFELEKGTNQENFHQKLYKIAKELELSPQEAFESIYRVLLGKPYGPKASTFILSLDRELVIKRFRGN